MEQNLSLVHEMLNKKGYKLTKQRKHILRAIYENNAHITIDEIFNKVREKEVGLSTVYRNIDKLKRVGVITEIKIADKVLYEPRIYRKKEFHIHFKCNHCGEIKDINDDAILENIFKLNLILQKNQNIEIKDVNIILSGKCGECGK
ncbi:Fur family transcriptional regulator [Clostridium ganghwense]|uniref:Fur family transcriptional regulator n=1 Tax=Clostridium ganghwense TaxID=312089 RepID=A0ABT4CKR3_9CLOT|nr:Fur family transcriptional regulator [Clostridium ganghwense]MCY6369623.1 Fur family transcriptional regulator [Clostridium ganghwense]